MDELVTQDVVRVVVRTGHRHDDPVLQRFRDTTGSFSDEAGERVGLLKVRVIGVHDDWLGRLELMLERPRQPLVPAFAHTGNVQERFGFLRVVVPVEVVCLQHLEVELVELDLITAEVLG